MFVPQPEFGMTHIRNRPLDFEGSIKELGNYEIARFVFEGSIGENTNSPTCLKRVTKFAFLCDTCINWLYHSSWVLGQLLANISR